MPRCTINWKKISLHHQCPERFFGPWPTFPLSVYIVYRVLIAGYTNVFTIWYAFFSPYSQASPWLFCTLWSYAFQAVTLTLSLWITIQRTWCSPKTTADCNSNSLDWYLKVKWVFYNVSSSMPLVVTIVYYGFLRIKIPFTSDATFLITDVQIHGMNSLMALLNQLLDPNPMHVHHFIHPLAFVLIYGLFSLMHYASGGAPLYPFLDWDHLGPTLLMGLVLCVLTCVVHLSVCYIKIMVSKCFPSMTHHANGESSSPNGRHDLF